VAKLLSPNNSITSTILPLCKKLSSQLFSRKSISISSSISIQQKFLIDPSSTTYDITEIPTIRS
ncbi:26211_t:CDS:1, partial [Racocetra persica]